MTPHASAPARCAADLPHPDDTEGITKSSTGYGRCAWCRNFRDGIRLIQITEAGSGPATAGRLFACSPCREVYGLVPLADQP